MDEHTVIGGSLAKGTDRTPQLRLPPYLCRIQGALSQCSGPFCTDSATREKPEHNPLIFRRRKAVGVFFRDWEALSLLVGIMNCIQDIGQFRRL